MSIELTFPEDYSREELINGEVIHSFHHSSSSFFFIFGLGAF